MIFPMFWNSKAIGAGAEAVPAVTKLLANANRGFGSARCAY